MGGETHGAGVIRILFEDADIVAVDKPEGIAVIPERSRDRPSLVAILGATYIPKLFVVHRLDKEVSGVLIFAKHADAHRHLNRLFGEREVWKTYVLVVHGRLQPADGSITIPLREFGSGRVAADPLSGKACTTDYWLREALGAYSVVTASPRTGRRHQIRAHFYGIGHPVVGDLRYGDQKVQRRYPRLMLHAKRIELALPSGARAVIESPLPPSFGEGLEGLRAETATIERQSTRVN